MKYDRDKTYPQTNRQKSQLSKKKFVYCRCEELVSQYKRCKVCGRRLNRKKKNERKTNRRRIRTC